MKNSYRIKFELWDVHDNRVWADWTPDISSSAPLKVWRTAILGLLAKLYEIIRARLT